MARNIPAPPTKAPPDTSAQHVDLQLRRPVGTTRLGNMNINNSGPNEWKKGGGIHGYRVVRGIRTLRAGVPPTAKTWTLRGNAGGTESKGFSVQTAAFFMNHPTIA